LSFGLTCSHLERGVSYCICIFGGDIKVGYIMRRSRRVLAVSQNRCESQSQLDLPVSDRCQDVRGGLLKRRILILNEAHRTRFVLARSRMNGLGFRYRIKCRLRSTFFTMLQILALEDHADQRYGHRRAQRRKRKWRSDEIRQQDAILVVP
jgi:hypothetical protein